MGLLTCMIFNFLISIQRRSSLSSMSLFHIIIFPWVEVIFSIHKYLMIPLELNCDYPYLPNHWHPTCYNTCTIALHPSTVSQAQDMLTNLEAWTHLSKNFWYRKSPCLWIHYHYLIRPSRSLHWTIAFDINCCAIEVVKHQEIYTNDHKHTT